MIHNLPSVLKSPEFLAIPDHLTVEGALGIVPKGFEDMIQSYTDGFDIHLELLNKDTYNRKVEIKGKVFQGSFPNFLFTDLRSEFILNQNQVLHLFLLHRFNQFKPMERPFINLITKDIERLMRYIRHQVPKAYNDRSKVMNTTVVINATMPSMITDFPLAFTSGAMNELKWKTFLETHPLALSSVGSMSKTNAVVLKGEGQSYRAPAYHETDKGFYSIFKSGQNVPARCQSHLINFAYQLRHPSQSIIQQDNLVIEGQLVPKDKTLREVVVVFHPFDGDRFIAGEGEISSEVAKTLVEVTINIEDCFLKLNVEEGKRYMVDTKEFVLGTNLLEEVTISDFKEFTVNSIKHTGINGSLKLNITGVKQAGNARIVSNTGIKSVTKVVPNLGSIAFKPMSFEEGLQAAIDKHLGQSSDLQPDLVIGMNSVKGKSNTIVLAQACLAVKLGYYKPKAKFGFEGLLNSLDEKEINEAARSLPEFTYTDRFGREVKVHIGLAYIQYTELCATYTRFKRQAFSFESGRVLANDNPTSRALFEHIWDTYLEKDKVEISKEFFKIYTAASTGIFNNDDNLPVYNLNELNNIFTSRDLVLTTVNQFPSDSLLLDEDFNQGFFIDLSKYENAPIIRIPSAKALKLFSGVLKNGDTIYHNNLINVSKVLQGCLRTDGGYRLNTVYAKDKSRDTPALAFNRYMANIKSTLFSSEDESQRLVQSFIKPQIPGVSLKQVVETLLPDDVLLFCDNRIYNRIRRESQETSEDDVLLLLLTQQIRDSDDVELQKELFKQLDSMSPMVLGVRSPCLWSGQTLKFRVWDKAMFEIYLKLYKDIDIKDVLDTHYNRDVMFSNYKLCEISRSDNDGEYRPL